MLPLVKGAVSLMFIGCYCRYYCDTVVFDNIGLNLIAPVFFILSDILNFKVRGVPKSLPDRSV